MEGDGESKKLRKPYTITKSRDRWTEEEHERFLDGLLLFGREWKKIEEFVGTKSVIQIRSHAQKYFLKVQKNGLMAHVPPPRPKRNRAYPYPDKDSEEDIPLQASIVCSSGSSCLISQCTSWDDKSMLIDYTSSSESMSSHDYNPLLPGTEGSSESSWITAIYNQNIASGSSSGSWMTYDSEKGTLQSPHPVVPNFGEVYNLIATIVDPDVTYSTGVYLQMLNEMDPITAKTFQFLELPWRPNGPKDFPCFYCLVMNDYFDSLLPQALILVKNLIANLSSPDFEPIRKWLLAYESNIKTSRESNGGATSANPTYSSLPLQCAGFLPSP